MNTKALANELRSYLPEDLKAQPDEELIGVAASYLIGTSIPVPCPWTLIEPIVQESIDGEHFRILIQERISPPGAIIVD